MFGFVVYAEDEIETEDSTSQIEEENELETKEINSRDQFKKEFKGEKDKLKEEKKLREEKREEFKNEIEDAKDEFEVKREERRNEVESIIKAVKEKREEFRIELESKKEEIKLKTETIKTNFKEDLKKVKDENKKIATEKIMEGIQLLNIKLTANFSEKIEKIENVLVGIESRITKAENRGLDVSSIKIMVEKAKESISVARDAISSQSAKVYEVNITGEETLKAEMKGLKEEFKKDIGAVKEKVKLAFTAVKDTAEALAKIPKIDDEEDSNEVEDNNTLENQ
jgi:hypothetical protein